uniref:Uncharacterized protein n=1 Tax=Chromera velia CCMP2878 TaxID=1169474 RepID=A0A0G4HVK6_9ALVE|eukprot:Cvel_8875.t1-p1 / transcript=Cvel_8875.t1 / gene=Cvel_8875 / organism=Chromera_velia_CCMP2878 / gene_product=hypothetical protein / transcript_product=hypothetical protein / location=Cvel_scaffold499:35046-36539(-) / protein_length=219 / sequence_SO=supercontig / SO=protein_coding / is_pseudo=false
MTSLSRPRRFDSLAMGLSLVFLHAVSVSVYAFQGQHPKIQSGWRARRAPLSRQSLSMKLDFKPPPIPEFVEKRIVETQATLARQLPAPVLERVEGDAIFDTHAVLAGLTGVLLLIFPGIAAAGPIDAAALQGWAPFILAVAFICSQASSLTKEAQRLLARTFFSMCAVEILVWLKATVLLLPFGILSLLTYLPTALVFVFLSFGYLMSGLLVETEYIIE